MVSVTYEAVKFFSAPQASVALGDGSEGISRQYPSQCHDQTPDGKPLSHRKIVSCEICDLRNAFRNAGEQRSEIQLLSCKVLSRWVSKSEDALVIQAKEIGKVNSAAFLLINRLCKDNFCLHLSVLSSVLIVAKEPFGDFFTIVHSTIEQLKDKMFERMASSNGLLKTPLVITPFPGYCVCSEDLEMLSESVAFYPKFDYPEGCSGSALVTLFINTETMEPGSLRNGLQKGMDEALKYVESSLPPLSKAIIQQQLR